MKNTLITATVLALYVNLYAQIAGDEPSVHTMHVCNKAKVTAVHCNIDNTKTSKIDPRWENLKTTVNAPIPADKRVAVGASVSAAITQPQSLENVSGFKMNSGKMYAVISGKNKYMTQYATLPNGTMVLPNGTIIAMGGDVQHLKNGQSVDMEGHCISVQKARTTEEMATMPGDGQ